MNIARRIEESTQKLHESKETSEILLLLAATTTTKNNEYESFREERFFIILAFSISFSFQFAMNMK